MQDLPGACLIAGALTFLFIFVISTLFAEHTGVVLPGWLTGRGVSRRRRRVLLVELPWVIAIIGGGEVVMLLFLLDSGSSLPVRVVSAAQLIVATSWLLFLARRLARSTDQASAEE